MLVWVLPTRVKPRGVRIWLLLLRELRSLWLLIGRVFLFVAEEAIEVFKKRIVFSFLLVIISGLEEVRVLESKQEVFVTLEETLLHSPLNEQFDSVYTLLEKSEPLII